MVATVTDLDERLHSAIFCAVFGMVSSLAVFAAGRRLSLRDRMLWALGAALTLPFWFVVWLYFLAYAVFKVD